MRLTDAELAARKRRNLWIAVGLVAFIVLIFVTTVLRLSRNLETQKAAVGPAAVEAAR